MAIFSLPINPKLNEEFVEGTFIPFLKLHKHLIFDLYFTCRMPPFLQDAMGDVFVSEKETTYNAVYISNQTEIPLSATFNNIYVVPNQQNLNLFIENFKPLYDVGIRTATIPHTSWILTGQIQKEFPDLYIKNTILREVAKANDIVSLARAGFHYINLDRDLMRNKDQLLHLKEAKEFCIVSGMPVKFSMLSNEGCWGGCPIMPEHYHYNSAREKDNPQYFNDSISRISCSSWDEKDSASSLKAANLPPWKKDWEEMFNLGIDVFKMHGRESGMRLKESMDIIERWNLDEELLFSQFNDYMTDMEIGTRPIDIWRDKIKNCKFNCWNCNYCDSVVKSTMKKHNLKVDEYTMRVLDSIDNASLHTTSFVESGYDVEGLSSNKIRHLLNNLCSYEDVKYLEIGVYNGSTFCAAIQNNDLIAYACDTWEDKNIKPFRDKIEWNNVEGSLETFISNVEKYGTNDSEINILQGDCRSIQQKNIHHKINLIFYDGNHDYDVQKESLTNLLNYVDDKFILVIDDCNFDGVVDSVDQFINTNKLTTIFKRLILTTELEDEQSWWNGIYLLVLEK